MRIAVIGATGKAGKLIVQEAVNRSHEVTAVSRRPHPNTPQGLRSRLAGAGHRRSEERRVGKECRSRWSPYH